MMNLHDCVVRNGQLITAAEATLPVSNTELEYGFGVYETLRVENGTLYFATQHIQRLLFSAEHIGLEHAFDAAAVLANLETLLAAALPLSQTFNVKILLLGGKTLETASLYLFASAPLFVDRKLYRDGCHTITVEAERPFPQAKTLAMLPSYLAFKKAIQAQAYDALMINRNGIITEGTRTNLFFVSGNTIVHASQEEILEGVTKQIITELGTQHGWNIEERSISINDLSHMDGAFLTSTSTKILPIATIDSHRFGETPSIIREIMQAYTIFWQESAGLFDKKWNA